MLQYRIDKRHKICNKFVIYPSIYIIGWISPVRNLQYVTIDRGNRFRNEDGNENNPPSSDDDEEEVVTDTPQPITSTGRSLE